MQLVGADVRWLNGWLDDPRTELLYDEVDVVDPGRFEHRHLLWPEGEFGVRFAEVSVVSAPASPDIYRVLMRRKRLESSAAFARTMGLYESARRGAQDLRHVSTTCGEGRPFSFEERRYSRGRRNATATPSSSSPRKTSSTSWPSGAATSKKSRP